MFLIDRPAASPALRADLAPRQLFAGTGDIIRAALMRPPVVAPAAPVQRRAAPQRDLPGQRRKTG